MGNTNSRRRLKMAKIIYPELSYKLMGIMFKIHNKIGGGYKEKYYQEMLKSEFLREGIHYLEQVKVDLMYGGRKVGTYYLDFLIDHKIVLEIKSKSDFSSRDIRQVLEYLKKTGLELGILVAFARDRLKYRRILKGYK
jgi:GxxExxY protein